MKVKCSLQRIDMKVKYPFTGDSYEGKVFTHSTGDIYEG